MHTRFLQSKHGPKLLVRPLRHGDVRTVKAVFDRLGEQVSPVTLQRPQASPHCG